MKKELHVGMSSTLITIVTDESIRKFSEISGDINPVHLDDAYAEKTIFKKRIAPGLQVASYISAVLANQLPGCGTIYLEQNIRFLKPVYIGDKIETKITIIEVLMLDKFRLKTEQFNGLGEKVIDGEAVVKYLGE